MKPVLIVENSINSLIRESNSGKKDYLLSGTFTEFGVKNRNERIYTADKFLPALGELNERITNLGVVYGEFDHPDVFDTSLSRASHIITKANYVKESNLVTGEIRLLSTYWGKEAKSLVDDGCPLFVSSRAAGVTESDGTVSLKKLFTYDIVADPGFASAKMSVKVLNESLGFCEMGQVEKNNFRIYELSDESKINDLFNMNKNEYVTKQQLTDYSQYLVKELASTKNVVKTALNKGNLEPKKLEQLLEYYEELNKTNSQVVKYLDYLAEKVQTMVNENKSLKETTEKLIEHNDYLAENLEKAVNYSEYLAENLDKNIAYSEYVAEHLDKNIAYSEYLAENLDKNIAYSEYIAESLDKNISYAEYIAEHVDNSIAYSEYIAEQVEGNIAYSEYIAEHLDDNIAYSEYIAENLDKSIVYQGLIVEKLNGGKLLESNEDSFPSLNTHFEEIENEVSDVNEFFFPELNAGEEEENEFRSEEDEANVAEESDIVARFQSEFGDRKPSTQEFADFYHMLRSEGIDGIEIFDVLGDKVNSLDQDAEEAAPQETESEEIAPEETESEEIAPEETESEEINGVAEVASEEIYAKEEGEKEEDCNPFDGKSDSRLSESIDKLIEEAKKRKVSETSDMNFLKFLNKSQVDSFYALTNEEQESVKLHINERSYFSGKEVLTLISEALSTKNESLEERVIRFIPENIKPIWEALNESSKKSILSQARLYPEDVLKNESQIEHFWSTRTLKKSESFTKKLVSETLIQEDKLSDNDVNLIMERFKSI